MMRFCAAVAALFALGYSPAASRSDVAIDQLSVTSLWLNLDCPRFGGRLTACAVSGPESHCVRS